jgi:hypothetical protein
MQLGLQAPPFCWMVSEDPLLAQACVGVSVNI